MSYSGLQIMNIYKEFSGTKRTRSVRITPELNTKLICKIAPKDEMNEMLKNNDFDKNSSVLHSKL